MEDGGGGISKKEHKCRCMLWHLATSTKCKLWIGQYNMQRVRVEMEPCPFKMLKLIKKEIATFMN